VRAFLFFVAVSLFAQEWTRHLIAEGFVNQTVVPGDFTGDGRIDVITNDTKRTILFVAPDWKPIVLHEGLRVLYGVAMDVDGDGDLDFIGAQFSPGVIFWLECPAKPLEQKWTFHLIDDLEHGGPDGVHGLALADIDDDGQLDLVASSGQPKGKFANSILWYRIPKLGPKGRMWERWVAGRWDAPGNAHYVAVGDVNGDKRIDIATGAKSPPDGNWFAWWEQPDAWDEPWKKHVIATNQEGASNILIADVNRDGKMDFVASRGHGFGLVWFEAPAWTEHVIDAEIAGPHALAVGDIDLDGDLDIACIGKNDFTTAWYENDGKGAFTKHLISKKQAAYDIRLIDMNADGAPDLLVAGENSKNVVWYENPLKRR